MEHGGRRLAPEHDGRQPPAKLHCNPHCDPHCDPLCNTFVPGLLMREIKQVKIMPCKNISEQHFISALEVRRHFLATEGNGSVSIKDRDRICKAIQFANQNPRNLNRNHRMKKAYARLHEIIRFDVELFVLCTLQHAITAHGEVKLSAGMVKIQRWWEKVEHPPSLTALTLSFDALNEPLPQLALSTTEIFTRKADPRIDDVIHDATSTPNETSSPTVEMHHHGEEQDYDQEAVGARERLYTLSQETEITAPTHLPCPGSLLPTTAQYCRLGLTDLRKIDCLGEPLRSALASAGIPQQPNLLTTPLHMWLPITPEQDCFMVIRLDWDKAYKLSQSLNLGGWGVEEAEEDHAP